MLYKHIYINYSVKSRVTETCIWVEKEPSYKCYATDEWDTFRQVTYGEKYCPTNQGETSNFEHFLDKI